MCVVSAVSDYYQNTWPQRFPENPAPWREDPVAAKLLAEVLAKLDKLDKRLGDIECRDATKAAFADEVAKAVKRKPPRRSKSA